MWILSKKVDLPANPVGSNASLSIWNAAQASSQGGTGGAKYFFSICQRDAAYEVHALRLCSRSCIGLLVRHRMLLFFCRGLFFYSGDRCILSPHQCPVELMRLRKPAASAFTS